MRGPEANTVARRQETVARRHHETNEICVSMKDQLLSDLTVQSMSMSWESGLSGTNEEALVDGTTWKSCGHGVSGSGMFTTLSPRERNSWFNAPTDF